VSARTPLGEGSPTIGQPGHSTPQVSTPQFSFHGLDFQSFGNFGDNAFLGLVKSPAVNLARTLRKSGADTQKTSTIIEKKAGVMSTKFRLENEYIELIKLLKVTGLCGSGGMAKVVTGEGCVKVDGVVELRKRCKIRKGQTVEFEGNIIELE
jgi:ribosome-associated protein